MGRFTKNIVLYLLIIATLVIAIDAFSGQSANKSELSYTGFIQQVQQKKVESVTITNDHSIKGKLKNGTEFSTYAPSDDTLIRTLQDNGVEITAAPPEQPAWWMSLLGSVIPIIILVVLFFFIMQQTQGGGGRVMNFGKSRAKLMGEGNVKVTFKDVAGAEEAKQELEEVVEFLKDPGKFTTIGAKIPKGVLLAGPPGTGKTLLAKAVAGEAGVPFFTISGSDFVEMFVGVGASRVRDLFTQAKKNSPCIIFIDEIDAVGRQRGAGLGGGHDEREQTLNQLLVEMDGFGANEGIITIAATNRPDILDPALLRPGRFDRQVIVGRPDLRGREAILKVHARNKPLADDVDLKTIAKKTPGFTGADLNNLLNEAALLAARLNKKVITMAEVEEASEKVSMGPERRSHIVSEKDRKLTAYHESGHAIVAHLLPHADPVHKVTIIPRGAAGGYTMMLPTEEQNYKTKSQLLADIRVALGGRIAEALILDEISTGASGDLQSVTNTARAMVTRWGMSDELGPIVFGEQQEQVFLGKNLGHERNYSEEIAAKIDSEIHRIVEEAYKDVTKLLSENEKFLHDMANALLEEETIDSKAVDNLYKYGTTKAPEVEEPKEILEAEGVVVSEVVESKENTATVDAPSETSSNEIK
ncbi:ATP-dependent zinc metalloprotease FtsH [uncultured Veillonella sp.]|uniref:ATP-dependent zinc metalloprotease FtsH n=1 Tax=uncultured Veillonella sp. TaxID=159268 RepID=UPI0028DCE1CC|nr:ATP-dependent zinc metalloprotease FtsH [uncultured Veillonella sp.]